MTERLYSGSQAHLLNGTHGPKLEPLLQRIMIGPDGKRGFESLEEIGGALTPGENFKFISQTDEEGEPTVKLLFRGQEYDVDLEKLEELSGNYAQRLKEQKEKAELPKFTLYVMRHGQSSENKSDPNRGLTETGQTQVRESFTRLLDEILAEEMPEFNDWDNAEAKKAAIARIAPRLEFHLRDSGTDRTIQQEWLEAQMLNELGVTDFYLPKAAYDWKKEEPPKKAGPGIAKRLKGIQGLDKSPDFRKLVGDKEYQQKVGAVDEITAWALTPDDKIPPGVENRGQMAERYHADLAKLQRVVQSQRLSQYPKRVIVVANSHASIITLGASEELDIPLTNLGEIENAEGLRLDFYSGGKPYKVKPFGEKTQAKVAELTKK